MRRYKKKIKKIQSYLFRYNSEPSKTLKLRFVFLFPLFYREADEESKTTTVLREYWRIVIPQGWKSTFCIMDMLIWIYKWSNRIDLIAIAAVAIPYSFNSLQWCRRVNQWFKHARRNSTLTAWIHTPTHPCHARENQVRWLRLRVMSLQWVKWIGYIMLDCTLGQSE